MIIASIPKGIEASVRMVRRCPAEADRIDMDTDEDGIGGQMTGPARLQVGPTDALFQGNVLEFGNKNLYVIAPVLQVPTMAWAISQDTRTASGPSTDDNQSVKPFLADIDIRK